MVAFNFTVFTDKVADRTKRMTIRKTARCKVDDRLQLYTGMRTKACRKLVGEDPVCVEVNAVILGADYIAKARYDQNSGPGLNLIRDVEALESFARSDGFQSFAAMSAWFEQKYGLPFNGYLHRWDWPE